MMPTDRYAESPRRILTALFARLADEPLALCVVVATVGGAVRAPGALMLVDREGRRSGYMSGGCIDEDIAAHAQECLASGVAKRISYGLGSPFIDMPLPCGGAIEIAILPFQQTAVPVRLEERLKAREVLSLAHALGDLTPDLPEGVDLSHCVYEPELRLRIAGRGADALALARLARFAQFDVLLQLVDEIDLHEAETEGFVCERLFSPSSPRTTGDDRWTAFVLAFHDTEWEGELLTEALAGPACYIGAVGSPRTQERRRQALAQKGLEPALDRIYGPVGLVPSQRDASKLAISTFAEILKDIDSLAMRTARTTGIVVLAAGSGERFQAGDKLLASYCGAPILHRTAQHRYSAPFARGVAVIPPDAPERRAILEQAGWTPIENPEARQGKSTSLRLALTELRKDDQIEGALILLGDMPNIRRPHLLRLLEQAGKTGRPVFTEVEGRPMPPVYIPRSAFSKIEAITGDAGMLSVLGNSDAIDLVPLDAFSAGDVDTVADLAAMASANA